LREVAGAR
jgi:hypothetical protein